MSRHEYGTRPPIPSVLHKLSTYTGGIEPTANETKLLRHKQATRKPLHSEITRVRYTNRSLNNALHCKD
ncbi:hypothetical protein ACTXT7_008421 [Hymenolepis weldensis]